MNANQTLLFNCRCGAPLKEINPEHAANVWNGELFCTTRCMAGYQSLAKSKELGIPDLSVLTVGQRFASDIFTTGDP